MITFTKHKVQQTTISTFEILKDLSRTEYEDGQADTVTDQPKLMQHSITIDIRKTKKRLHPSYYIREE